MKSRRILVLLAALLVFVGSAATATASAAAAESGRTQAESGSIPRRKSPTVATLSVARRAAVLAPGAGRRVGGGRAKLRALGVVSGASAHRSHAARVRELSDARSLRGAYASQCGRGPPATS